MSLSFLNSFHVTVHSGAWNFLSSLWASLTESATSDAQEKGVARDQDFSASKGPRTEQSAVGEAGPMFAAGARRLSACKSPWVLVNLDQSTLGPPSKESLC